MRALLYLLRPAWLQPDNVIQVSGVHSWNYPVGDARLGEENVLVENLVSLHVWEKEVWVGVEVDQAVATEGKFLGSYHPIDVDQGFVVVLEYVHGQCGQLSSSFSHYKPVSDWLT